MRALTIATTLALGITTTLAVAVLAQQHDHGSAPGRLGAVHFATSCAPAVQKDFDRGIALLHSFWFSAAIESFNRVLEADPQCVMAQWGIAMSWWGNPFAGFRSPQAVKTALTALDAAKATGAGTDREKAYLAAVDLLFRDAATCDQRTRSVKYEKAMEALAASHADDVEARIFYALALAQTALPSDKTYANQLKAAGILEQEFKRQPEHPGLAHYIIHSFDVPPLAPRALDAARRYAKIAPDAPHALHMPSHTFTRVGFWQESIDANLASAAAAHKDNALRGTARARLSGLCLPQTRRTGGPAHAGGDRPARRADSDRQRRQRRAAAGGLLRACGDPGTLRARARRLGRCRGAHAAPDAVRPRRCHHAFRARARRRPQQSDRRRPGGPRPAHGIG